jgi:hypothetical protein
MKVFLTCCALAALVSPAPALALGNSFFSDEQMEMLGHLAQAGAYDSACKVFVINLQTFDEKLHAVGLAWDDAVVQNYIFYRADILLAEQQLKGDPRACERAYDEYGLAGSIEPDLLWLLEKPMEPEFAPSVSGRGQWVR